MHRKGILPNGDPILVGNREIEGPSASALDIFLQGFKLFKIFPSLSYMDYNDKLMHFFHLSQAPKNFESIVETIVKGEGQWKWVPHASKQLPHVGDGWRLEVLPNVLSVKIPIESSKVIDHFMANSDHFITSQSFGLFRTGNYDPDRSFKIALKPEKAIEIFKRLAVKLVDEKAWSSVVTVYIQTRGSLKKCLAEGGWVVLKVSEKGSISSKSKIESWLKLQLEEDDAVGDLTSAFENFIIDLEQMPLQDMTQMLVRPSCPIEDSSPWTVINMAKGSLEFFRHPVLIMLDCDLDVVLLFQSKNEHRRPLAVATQYSLKLIGRFPVPSHLDNAMAFLNEVRMNAKGTYLKYHAEVEEFSVYRLDEWEESCETIKLSKRVMKDPLHFSVKFFGHGPKPLVPLRISSSHVEDLVL